MHIILPLLKNRWKMILVLAVMGAIVYAIALRQGSNTKNLTDSPSPAPELVLPDLTDKSVRLSDFKGQVVLLDFWATWCPPCLAEIPHFKELYTKYKDKGFTILGVSMDEAGQEVVEPFVKEHELPYPIVMSGGDPVEGYYVPGLPTAYLIDREGRIVKRYVGFKFPEELEKDIASLL